MPAAFARQTLWSKNELPYSVHLQGFLLDDPVSGKKILLTESEIDPLVIELVTLNGYTISPHK